MFNPIKRIKDKRAKEQGHKRSPHWNAFKRAYFKTHEKKCAVCGGTKKVELHHIIPFHIDSSKELDPNNVIPLCEGNKELNCHLIFGHFGNFRTKWNPNIEQEAPVWQQRLQAKDMSELISKK